MTPQEHQNRISQLRAKLSTVRKEAFAPPGTMPPPVDPNTGMPMGPAMMGGAPPMDPAMMGGAPPMGPAMMGGAPPMDPAMAAALAGQDAGAPGEDQLAGIMERVNAIGLMLLKLFEVMNIPLDDSPAGDAAAAIAPEAADAVSAEEQARAQAAEPLSEHAQDALGGGFIGEQVNRLNAQ